MYYLTGFDNCMQTVKDLAAAAGFKQQGSQKDLRQGLVGFIRSVQTEQPRPDFGQPLYCFDQKKISKLVGHYKKDCILTDIKADLQPTPDSSMMEALKVADDALQLFAEIDEDLYRLFRTVIHTIFYTRSLRSGGGSSSSILGVIWYAHRKNWDIKDIMEFSIHELTHNLVFLDEFRHVHYLDLRDIADPDNWAQKACAISEPKLGFQPGQYQLSLH